MTTFSTGVSGISTVYTSRIGYYRVIIVTECLNLLGVGVAVVMVTGVSHYTLLGTCGRQGHTAVVIVMSLSGDFFLLGKDISTDRTLQTVSKTGCGTSGVKSGDKLLAVVGAKILSTNVTYVISICISMSGRRNVHGYSGGLGSTSSTIYCILVITEVYTIGSNVVLNNGFSTGMTGSGSLVRDVLIATSRTCVSGIAAYSTSGCGNYRIVAMAVCLNVICCVGVATYGASEGGIAAICTIGGGYCCIVAMSVCGNSVLSYCSNTTYSTLLALGKTGFGTSGSLACNSFFYVAKCGEANAVSGHFDSASSTVNYVIIRTGIYTVGSSTVFDNSFSACVCKCRALVDYSILISTVEETVSSFGAVNTASFRACIVSIFTPSVSKLIDYKMF